MTTNLTDKQQQALQELVGLGRSWREEFYIIWHTEDVNDIPDYDSDPPQISKGDIRALVKEDLLIGEFLDSNQVHIVLTQKSYQTVDSDFKIKEAPQMKNVFISHASKDKAIVDAFVDELLVGALAVQVKDIFCTSTDGTKITSGEDWRNEIRDNLKAAKITFLIVTQNYKESEICMNEMGAAWVLSGRTIPFIVAPIDYHSVGVLQDVRQIEILQDEKSLDRIRDIVQNELKIPAEHIKSDRWTEKKKIFLDKLAKHLASNPFEEPLNRESFTELTTRYAGLRAAMDYLGGENSRLEHLNAELKNAVSQKEFAEIEKKHQDNSLLDEFKSLCGNVGKLLKTFSPLLRGIIFADYSGKEIGVKTDRWDKSIDLAIASDFLIEDPLGPNWYTTKEMRVLESALKELSAFINRYETEDKFTEVYEKEFDAPLSLSNMDFWTDVLGTPIALE